MQNGTINTLCNIKETQNTNVFLTNRLFFQFFTLLNKSKYDRFFIVKFYNIYYCVNHTKMVFQIRKEVSVHTVRI